MEIHRQHSGQKQASMFLASTTDNPPGLHAKRTGNGLLIPVQSQGRAIDWVKFTNAELDLLADHSTKVAALRRRIGQLQESLARAASERPQIIVGTGTAVLEPLRSERKIRVVDGLTCA